MNDFETKHPILAGIAGLFILIIGLLWSIAVFVFVIGVPLLIVAGVAYGVYSFTNLFLSLF